MIGLMQARLALSVAAAVLLGGCQLAYFVREPRPAPVRPPPRDAVAEPRDEMIEREERVSSRVETQPSQGQVEYRDAYYAPGCRCYDCCAYRTRYSYGVSPSVGFYYSRRSGWGWGWGLGWNWGCRWGW